MSIFVAIDFETSGKEANAACSVGMVRIENGRLTRTFSSLIRPPSSRVLFSWVHGLTWADLCRAPTFTELWPQMEVFFAGAQGFVAHNAPFDRSVFNGCCTSFLLPNPELPFYCTLKGARAALKLPSKTLDALCAHYQIPLNHHEALSDALACARIFVLLQQQGLDVERMRLNPPGAACKRRTGPGKTLAVTPLQKLCS